jgi:hypothetical protein
MKPEERLAQCKAIVDVVTKMALLITSDVGLDYLILAHLEMLSEQDWASMEPTLREWLTVLQNTRRMKPEERFARCEAIVNVVAGIALLDFLLQCRNCARNGSQ